MEREIAQTIVSQVKALDPFALGAWGARDLHALPAGTKAGAINEGAPALGGLAATVSGAKHKGLLRVLLMPSDTYRIEIFKRSYENFGGRRVFAGYKLKDSVEGVYFENLVRVIDGLVEKEAA